MHTKIDTLFNTKKTSLLSVFFTAGYPELNDTIPVLQYLQSAGVDLVEVGIPYSDPLADGPVIQQTGQQAIKNGMNLHLLLQQLKEAKESIQIPVLLMGYLNPVMQYGIEKFAEDCFHAGVSGIIIPDLPLDEYLLKYDPIFRKYQISNINLITPRTSEERIRYIDEHSNGFIYVVSSSSITGNSLSLQEATIRYFSRIRDMKLNNPCLIGFGIQDHESFQMASEYAQGAIIGSAFLRMLSSSKNMQVDIQKFIEQIK